MRDCYKSVNNSLTLLNIYSNIGKDAKNGKKRRRTVKNWKKQLAVLAAFVLFAGGFLFTDPTVAYASQTLLSSPASSRTGAEKDNTKITDKFVDAEPANIQKWKEVCINVGKTLKNKGFHYSNSEGGRTLAASARGPRACNCALYVSWCLQEYGAIKRGKTFYSNGSRRPNKKLGSKVKLIRKYKKAKNAHLQPGDITCFSMHICIYAGRSKSGKMLWFDQGKVATYGNRAGARYKSYGARQESYLDRSTVGYVIRIKDIKE